MKHPHNSIIWLWPTASEFAKAVSKHLDEGEVCTSNNVRIMRLRGIPPKFWTAVVAAVADAGFDPITYANLAEMAKQPASAAP